MSDKIRVIIAGGRLFNDAKMLFQVCDFMLSKYLPENIEVVSGHCVVKKLVDVGIFGADLLGETWAASIGASVRTFPANWAKFGKAAGPIRNAEMAEYADALIAFWDGKSDGTGDMIKKAKALGLKVKVVTVQY